jgi:acetyltransferase-like isoleucine patch superfamily enzyme
MNIKYLPIKIGNNVWIGGNVILLGGISLEIIVLEV